MGIPSDAVTLKLLLLGTMLFVAASVLYFIRVVRSRTVPDLVLAVDVLAYDLAVFIIAFSIMCKSPYLSVGALPLVLWAYLMDMYVSKHLSGRELGE